MGKNVAPEYSWFNGEMNYTTFKTIIDDRKIVSVNHPDGAANDPFQESGLSRCIAVCSLTIRY